MGQICNHESLVWARRRSVHVAPEARASSISSLGIVCASASSPLAHLSGHAEEELCEEELATCPQGWWLSDGGLRAKGWWAKGM